MAIRLKFFLLLLLVASQLNAEVYWLRGGGSNNFKADKLSQQNEQIRFENSLQFQEVFSEEIIINGYRTRIHVGNSRDYFGRLIDEISYLDGSYFSIVDANSMIVTINNTKYLISNLGQNFKALIFKVSIPPELSRATQNLEWQRLLSDVTIDNIIEYPARNGKYITFSNLNNIDITMRKVSDYLEGENFYKIDPYSKSNRNIFINYKNNNIVTISLDERSDSGFIYQRIKK